MAVSFQKAMLSDSAQSRKRRKLRGYKIKLKLLSLLKENMKRLSNSKRKQKLQWLLLKLKKNQQRLPRRRWKLSKMNKLKQLSRRKKIWLSRYNLSSKLNASRFTTLKELWPTWKKNSISWRKSNLSLLTSVITLTPSAEKGKTRTPSCRKSFRIRMRRLSSSRQQSKSSQVVKTLSKSHTTRSWSDLRKLKRKTSWFRKRRRTAKLKMRPKLKKQKLAQMVTWA